MEIERTETNLKVASPYNSALPSRAKKLGGRWNSSEKLWVYDIRTEAQVADLYRDIYGEWDDSTVERVTLRCVVGDCDIHEPQDSIQIAGRVVARAYGRDSGAKLGDGVVVETGGFGSGGSHKNWTTVARAGTVFLLYDVPRKLAEKQVTNPDFERAEIVSEPVVDREALRAERTRLMERIAEIDAILA